MRAPLRRLLVPTIAVIVAAGLLPVAATVRHDDARPAARTAASVPAKGLERLTAAVTPAQLAAPVRAVATFGGRTPTTSVLDRLRGLGLDVVALRNLPMALVQGPLATLTAAVRDGIAVDMWPDERLEYDSKESDAAVGADVVHAQLGVTGKGVGVAVVDTGVDASHPALAKRVTHNVKFVGLENLQPLGYNPRTSFGDLAIPVDKLPYNNSDTSSGHGTHVAGIVAADGTGNADLVGMAPGANLIGYGTGDGLFIFDILAAYDDILAHHKEWGIRVVNNSWGSSYRLFDPDEPTNLATKAVADAGLVVVFSAGNDGVPGSVNPYSVAPWVISVASGTVSKEKSDFTSGGLPIDNAIAATVGVHRHLRFAGDGLGMYHPDIAAPGSDILSTGTPTAVGILAPAPPGGTAIISGTSMAAPHVSGLAALLFEARPSLSPAQVREVMQVTATPLRDGTPFQYAGYGFIDAKAAVELVRRPDFGPELLGQLQADADRAVLAARPFAVRQTDLWGFKPDLVTAGGLDQHTVDLDVGPGTTHVFAAVSRPSSDLLGLLGLDLFDYQVDLRDAAGTIVASSTPSSSGQSTFLVDLAKLSKPPQLGRWTVDISGNLSARDTDFLIGNKLTLTIVQLTARTPTVAAGPSAAPKPVFAPSGKTTFYFQPTGEPGPLPSPEGCALALGPARGGLDTKKPTGDCQEGLAGFVNSYGLDAPARFTSAPITAPLAVGGPAEIALWTADLLQPVWGVAFGTGLAYQLIAIGPDGRALAVAGGEVPDSVPVGPTGVRSVNKLDVPPTLIPVGSRLELTLRFSGVYTATQRLVFGGAKFADAGLTLTTGAFR